MGIMKTRGRNVYPKKRNIAGRSGKGNTLMNMKKLRTITEKTKQRAWTIKKLPSLFWNYNRQKIQNTPKTTTKKLYAMTSSTEVKSFKTT